jgi:hypothetical protein
MLGIGRRLVAIGFAEWPVIRPNPIPVSSADARSKLIGA